MRHIPVGCDVKYNGHLSGFFSNGGLYNINESIAVDERPSRLIPRPKLGHPSWLTQVGSPTLFSIYRTALRWSPSDTRSCACTCAGAKTPSRTRRRGRFRARHRQPGRAPSPLPRHLPAAYITSRPGLTSRRDSHVAATASRAALAPSPPAVVARGGDVCRDGDAGSSASRHSPCWRVMTGQRFIES